MELLVRGFCTRLLSVSETSGCMLEPLLAFVLEGVSKYHCIYTANVLQRREELAGKKLIAGEYY